MTDQRKIAVEPAEGGWALAYDAQQAPMLFLSGARAEAQAHALARRLSAAGHDVELTVRDRARNLVGSTRYPAHEFA